MPKSPVPYGDQPAFPSDVPVEWYDTGETKRTASGLTVRDWLAARAISALSQQWLNMDNVQRKAYSDCEDSGIIWGRDFERFVAKQAYKLADAMLAARERPIAAPSTSSS